MTQDLDLSTAGDPDPSLDEQDRVRTGVASVDEVIVEVDGLVDRPVEEHVAVFESAHDRLRRALDVPSGDA